MATSEPNANENSIARTFRTLTKIEPHEMGASIISFLFLLSVMSGYYILRPIRDQMSSDFSDTELAQLWTATFFFSLLLVPVYGFVVSKVKLDRLIPWVYGFLALNILGFFAIFRINPDATEMGAVYYVWISVFNMFVISVFWSFMANIFNKEQSKRIFGFIAAGASIGAIIGPIITVLLVDSVGTFNLLPISAAFLIIPVFLLQFIIRNSKENLKNDHTGSATDLDKSVGTNPFAGFTLFFRSPYLMGIGVFIILYTFMSSVVYFELKNMMVDVDRDQRTEIWAFIDLAVNVLAIGTAMFGTSRLATRFGLVVTLALVPVIMIFGFATLSFAPILVVAIGLQIVRRAGNYAITKPGREMLFTVLTPEEKLKAKNVIDTAVYRGGDMASGWAFTGLSTGLALGAGPIAAIGAVVAGVWALVGIFLGRAAERAGAGVEASSKPGELNDSVATQPTS